MGVNIYGKLLMSLAIAIFAFIPPLADLATETHVYHPGWMPHARMHTVWLLGITSTIGLVALYLLWIRKKDPDFNTNLAAVLGLCVYGSFFVSTSTASLYGGAATDVLGGIEQRILGMELNLFTFTVASTMLGVGWSICKWRRT